MMYFKKKLLKLAKLLDFKPEAMYRCENKVFGKILRVFIERVSIDLSSSEDIKQLTIENKVYVLKVSNTNISKLTLECNGEEIFSAYFDQQISHSITFVSTLNKEGIQSFFDVSLDKNEQKIYKHILNLTKEESYVPETNWSAGLKIPDNLNVCEELCSNIILGMNGLGIEKEYTSGYHFKQTLFCGENQVVLEINNYTMPIVYLYINGNPIVQAYPENENGLGRFKHNFVFSYKDVMNVMKHINETFYNRNEHIKMVA